MFNITEYTTLISNHEKMKKILEMAKDENCIIKITISIENPYRKVKSESFDRPMPIYTSILWNHSEEPRYVNETISVTEQVDSAVLFKLANDWFRSIKQRIVNIKEQLNKEIL